MTSAYPYPYVGSGVAAARKQMEIFVCFRDAVPKAARKGLQRGVPDPLDGYFQWSDQTLVFGNDNDSLQWVVRASYADVEDPDDEHDPDPEFPSDAMWRAFNEQLDAWLAGIHAQHPIALVIKPIDEEFSTETDDWHAWSCERIPGEAMPIVAALGKRHDDVVTYLAQMWRAWLSDEPFERQQAVIGALDDDTRARLKKRKALFKPVPAEPEPRVPTVDEGERIWRALAADPGPLRLEDAFTRAMREGDYDPEYDLSNHVGALLDANRRGDVIAVARAVLASGAEFPSNWWPTLADALVATGRIAEAEPIVREILGALESYKSEMLATVLRYHRARGERDDEALLYHAGMKWFTHFTSEITKKEAKAYGTAPDDLPARFIRYLARWVAESHWQPPRCDASHWLVWFGEIADPAAAPYVDILTAERDRRIALRKALEQCTDEASARVVVDELLQRPPDAISVAPIADKLRKVAPLATYDLLRHATTRTGYRYHQGDEVSGVMFLTYLALNEPALVDKLPEAYALALGFELVRNAGLHYNLACCACRLGHREAALRHVARALAEGWKDPRQIHDDNDLAQLRHDPDFEKLFPKLPRVKLKPTVPPLPSRKGI